MKYTLRVLPLFYSDIGRYYASLDKTDDPIRWFKNMGRKCFTHNICILYFEEAKIVASSILKKLT